MRREVLAGLVFAASATFLAGCSGFEAETTQTTTTQNSPELSVDINTLPSSLPDAISRMAIDAVAVNGDDSIKKVNLGDGLTGQQVTTYHGSGIRIGNNIYLTAGHVVNGPNDKPLPYADTCGDLAVDAPSTSPTALGTAPNGSIINYFGESLETQQEYGDYTEYDISNTLDVALVRADDTQNDLPKLERVVIAEEPPTIGSRLYFINYEPDVQGDDRDPYQAGLTNSEIAEKLDKPAIFGGIVIGKANGKYIVVNGLKGYGATGDAFGRAGESGGPVFNERGQLVGISVQGPLLNGNKGITVADLEDTWLIKLTGVPKDMSIDYTLVQPIDSTMIDKLESLLAKAPKCKFNSSSLAITP